MSRLNNYLFFTLLRGALPIPSWDYNDCFSDTWKHLNSFLGWRILSALPSTIWHIASLACLVIYCSVSNFNMHRDSLPTAEYERRGGLRYYLLAPQSMSIKVYSEPTAAPSAQLRVCYRKYWHSYFIPFSSDLSWTITLSYWCFGPTATEFVLY